jgi:hypothetical protein
MDTTQEMTKVAGIGHDTMANVTVIARETDEPTRHRYRAAFWKSSPGSSSRRVARSSMPVTG